MAAAAAASEATSLNLQQKHRLFARIHTLDFGDKVDGLRAAIADYLRKENHSSSSLDIDEVRSRIRLLAEDSEEDESSSSSEGEAQKSADKNSSTSSSSLTPITDWMLKRLLITAPHPLEIASALEHFTEVFTFRSEATISRLTLRSTLPREFFQLGILHSEPRMVDRYGNRLFIIRAKYYKKLPQMDVLVKRAGLYLLEKHDRQFEAGAFPGVTVLLDMADFDYRQINYDLLKFALKVGLLYAGPLKAVLVVHLHWAFTFLLRVVESWLTLMLGYKLSIFRLLGGVEELKRRYIDEHCLPAFLGGSIEEDQGNDEIPSEALPFSKLADQLVEEGLLEAKNGRKIAAFLEELMKEKKKKK